MKILTKKEQLELLNQSDAIEKMREYVAISGEILSVAFSKRLGLSLNDDDPQVVEIVNKLSPKESKVLMEENIGTIFSETWLKMLDVFPHDVCKELMIKYCEGCCFLHEAELIKMMDVFAKEDAKDVLTVTASLDEAVMSKILNIFSKEEAKDIILCFIKEEEKDNRVGIMDDGTELLILHFFDKEDVVEIMTEAIDHTIFLETNFQKEMFEVLPLDECQKLIEKVIEDGDGTLDFETLEKIIEVFPKPVAEKLIHDEFQTNHASDYTDEDYNYLIDLLAEKDE